MKIDEFESRGLQKSMKNQSTIYAKSMLEEVMQDDEQMFKNGAQMRAKINHQSMKNEV